VEDPEYKIADWRVILWHSQKVFGKGFVRGSSAFEDAFNEVTGFLYDMIAVHRWVSQRD